MAETFHLKKRVHSNEKNHNPGRGTLHTDVHHAGLHSGFGHDGLHLTSDIIETVVAGVDI